MNEEARDFLFSTSEKPNTIINPDKPRLLVALGGNALIDKEQEGTIAQQFENLKVPILQLARLSRDYKLIITHGNGPQVGNLLLQQESCDQVPRLPLEILVAQTQGQIGYMIESTLDSELMRLGIIDKQIVCLITYVVVDENDPAFFQPSKPIGPIYTKEQIGRLNHPVRMTAKGYRRVVASPQPKTIVEKHEIKSLVDMDYIVICGGGGGIPVTRGGRRFYGMNAVIDKDLASAKLAEEVGVDILLMATNVEGAAINYGKNTQQILHQVKLSEIEQYQKEGHFPPGSMGPKIEAGLRFLRGGGGRSIITSTITIEEAVAGRAGTIITR
ncbi:MAG: carbamate kinase [Phycisphaerae bacterium SM23_30]|nr:MAG: carbamate kinase [Phycisphaerae bacterium SM23_30]